MDYKDIEMLEGEALVLRVCDKEGKSDGGFQWPKSGAVTAPDWRPTAECGNGLHGWLRGEGNHGFAERHDEGNAWLVVAVDESTVIDLGGKVKYPSGRVVYFGDQEGATDIIRLAYPDAAVIGATSTAGELGILVIEYWDDVREIYWKKIGYVGENGLKPNAAYRLNQNCEFEEVEE